MTKRYQIIRKPRKMPDGSRPRWSFVAHGATYEKEHAEETRELIAANSGDKTRLLSI